ncbi:MAG: EamA family transporter [Alphaproteobacteria bacterium]
MDPLVIALVLAAAVMHAIWNAVIKLGEDRLMIMAVVIGMGAVLSPALLLSGPPPLPESWRFIALSVALHCVYFFFLIQAYRVGDLSHAYPLARGSAPLLVAAGAALFAGETLNTLELLAVALVSAGIVSLLFAGGYGLSGGWRVIVYPLATGVMIAAYTVADGLGVRLSGNPAAYIGWLFLLSAIPIGLFALHRRRGAALVFLREKWKPSVGGGLLAFTAYALAIWALSLGAMAHVSALRETSVVIAALIGTRFLGEPFGRRRLLSATAVAAGVVLLTAAA